MNIEVELRSFISEEKYEELLNFFRTEATFLGEDYQETFYFDSDQDLRIQRNNNGAKVWLKKGNLHDDHREEIEMNVSKEDFETLENLFRALKYGVDIKWYRKRNTFHWQGISIMLDNTLGYGHILELEKMSTAEEKDDTLALLRQKLSELEIPLTPKEIFNERFEYYKENWRELVP